MRFLLASIVPLVLVIYVLMMNPQSVHVKLTNNLSYDVPFVLVMVVLMAVGFLIAYLMSVGREMSFLMERRRWKKIEGTRAIVEALYSAAELLYRDGRREDALDLLRKALKENATYVPAAALMGRILREEGRFKEALQVHAKVRQGVAKNSVLGVEVAEDYLAIGDYPRAADELQSLMKDKGSPKALVLKLLVEAYIGMNDTKRAIAFQERLVKQVPHDVREREERRLIGLFYQCASEEKDESVILKLTKRHPDFIPAYMMYSQIAEPKKAIERLQKGLMENPDALELADRLMDLVVEGVHPSEAIHFFQRFASVNTKRPGARISLVMVYLRLGMFSEAVKAAGLIDAPLAMADLLRAKAREANGEDKIALEIYSKGCKDALLMSFRCVQRGSIFDNWQERCERCGDWSSIHLEYL